MIAVSIALLAAVAGCGGEQAPQPATAVVEPLPAGRAVDTDSADGLYALFSARREDAGLAVPARDPALDVAAETAARDMAERGYFSPVDPEGRTPFDRVAPLGWSRAGESILQADAGVEAAAVMDAWIATPPYLENLDGAWDATGVGGWVGTDGSVVWVQIYAAGRVPQGSGSEGGNTLP